MPATTDASTTPTEAPKAWQPPQPAGWAAPPQPGWVPPQQQSWAPPPQPGWMAPPPGNAPPGPTQMSYPGAPGWATGQYPAQPGYWRPPPIYGSSPLAVVAAILLLVIGILVLLFGLVFLLLGAAGEELLLAIDPSLFDEAGAVAAVMLFVAVLFISMGSAEIASSIGVFVHKGWARWLGVVMASIGLVLGFLLLIGIFADPAASGGGDTIIVLIWLAAHGFVIAALAAAGEHFRQIFTGR